MYNHKNKESEKSGTIKYIYIYIYIYIVKHFKKMLSKTGNIDIINSLDTDRIPNIEEDLENTINTPDMYTDNSPFPRGTSIKLTPLLSSPWSKDIVTHLEKDMAYCFKKATEHNQAAIISKKMDIYTRLPSIIIPAIMGSIILIVPDTDENGDITLNNILSTIGLVLTSMLTILCSFYEFQKHYYQHDIYENRYKERYQIIRAELTKDKEYRQNAEVFLVNNRDKLDYIRKGEPRTDIAGMLC